MRAVLLEVPEQMLAERRRLGLDGRDELWDGELHMAPPPGERHQRIGSDLLVALSPVVRRLGLVATYETGLFRAGDDYRVPDLVVTRPDQRSERGAESAELVVELRSPDDETYAKLPFYAALGVREVVVVHPDDRRVELFRLAGDRLLPVTGDAAGAVRSDVLGVQLRTGDGALHLAWDGGSATV